MAGPRNGKNVFDILLKLPAFGVGQKIARKKWLKYESIFWKVTDFVPDRSVRDARPGDAPGCCAPRCLLFTFRTNNGMTYELLWFLWCRTAFEGL